MVRFIVWGARIVQWRRSCQMSLLVSRPLHLNVSMDFATKAGLRKDFNRYLYFYLAAVHY